MRKTCRVTLLILLALALCIPSVGATTAGALQPGTYQVAARGHNGDISLRVNLTDKEISSIDVLSHVETAIVSDAAFDAYMPSIVQHQSLGVDIVSGATLSCVGIRAAVSKAIEDAGGVPGEFMTAVEKPAGDETALDYDLVIVGSGVAGLAAAIEAREEGASVLVVEQLSHIGGSSLISGGFIYGTGSKHQEALGVDSGTAEEMVSYWMSRAQGDADESMLRFVASRSGETIDWYVDELGASFPVGMPTGINPIASGLITGTGGHGFIIPLKNKCDELGVDILLNTTAQSLLTDDEGVVAGIAATSGNDSITVHAKKVILATGGYDASREAKASHSPIITGEASFSSPQNTGDGIRMATEVGAATVFKGGYIGFRGVPGHVYGDAITFLWPNGIMVNEKGERFLTEGIDYPVMHELMLEDGSSMFYNIIDSTGYNAQWDRAIADGVAYKGETAEELAAAMGVDAATLQATFERYNALCAAGSDEDFGKDPSMMVALNQAPYYAAQCVNTTIGSLGGIQINQESRVLDESGFTIPNLYAAGACANGDFFGTVYPASGTSIQMSTTFGRIAGAHAARAALSKPVTHAAMRRAVHVDRHDPQFVYSTEEALDIASAGSGCFSNQRVINFVCTTTVEFAESVLPPPLEADDTPLVYFMICDSDPYAGLVVQLTCLYNGQPGTYALGYVMESDTSTLYGRGFLGEPKKVGDVYLDITGNKITGKTLRHGEVIMELEATIDAWNEVPEVDASAKVALSDPNGFFHRYTMNPDGTGIDNVEMIGFRSYGVPIASATIGEHSLTVYPTSDDIYSLIPLESIVAVTYGVSDLYIGGVIVEEDLDANAHLPYAFFEHDDYRDAGFRGAYVNSTPNKLELE